MKFKGLVVAANTPFQSDLELDLERIPSLTDYLVGQKLAGLFVCGSTGECSGMTAPEAKPPREVRELVLIERSPSCGRVSCPIL